MKGDPAIESIRKTRQDISRRFGHDTKALIAHYEKMQEDYADRLVADPSAVYVPTELGQAPAVLSSGSTGGSGVLGVA